MLFSVFFSKSVSEIILRFVRKLAYKNKDPQNNTIHLSVMFWNSDVIRALLLRNTSQ